MVYYSLDKKIRTPIIVIIAIISISILPFIKKYLPQNFDAPSVFAIFGALYFIFNKWIWKLPYIPILTGLPNLNGEWEGYLTREDFTNGVKENDIKVKLIITQTWTEISMVFKNENEETVSGITKSSTRVCGMDIKNKNAITIKDIFEYDKAQGNSELTLSKESDGLWLKGYYQSNIPRIGYIQLKKTQ